MKQILFLLLITPIWAWAENSINVNTQIQLLEGQLERVQQESQATFQRFQMIQEMRRNEIQNVDILPPTVTSTSNPADMLQLKQAKNERIQQYTADLDQVYQYHKELEDKRKLLIEEIDLLMQNFPVLTREAEDEPTLSREIESY